VQIVTRSGRSGQTARDTASWASSALVVFAALDGHHLGPDGTPDPEFRAAVASLERGGVPVVVWSGHTRAEIEMVRQQMEIRAPFVSESGAALFVPTGYFPFAVEATRRVPGYDVIEFGAPYNDLVATLRQAARAVQTDIVTLADMTLEEVAADFRLPLLEARLATLREYSELFRVLDDRPASRGRLFRALHARGLACSRGTRYDLLMGVSNRTVALQTAHRLLQRARGRVTRIGIGSRTEDLPVLAQADVRILVRDLDSTVTGHILAQMPVVHLIEQPGLQGWLEAITRVTAASRGRCG